jgi:hypothetical protein
MGDALSQLTTLGRRHKKLRADLDALRPELAEAIVTAHTAGIPQVQIAEAAGYTREMVRTLCLTDAQREAERETRRQRTRRSTGSPDQAK